MGNGASGVVDELNSRLKPPSLIAEALVIVGLVGPDTDARISATELQPVLLLVMVISPTTVSSGGPLGQPSNCATPSQLALLLYSICR